VIFKFYTKIKKEVIIFSTLVFSTLIALFIWDKIIIPYDLSNKGFEGPWTQGYHPQNDTLKFFIYILLTIMPFFFILNKLYKNNIFSITGFLKIDSIGKENKNKEKHFGYMFYFLIFLLFIEFFFIDFKIFISPIDIFHEGLWLTPSSNFRLTGGIWSSSFLERGFFGNLFPTILSSLSSDNLIGVSRFCSLLLLFTNKVLIIFLAKNISTDIAYEGIKKIFFFVFLVIILLSFVDYYDTSHFSKRHSLYLLFFNILFLSIPVNNKISLSNTFLGLIALMSFFWWLDIALYLNVVSLIVLFFYLYRKEYYKILSYIFGYLIGLTLILILLPNFELELFVSNSIDVVKSLEIVGNLKYPSPLFGGDGRATKTLIFFTLTGVLTLATCLFKNNKLNNNLRLFYFFFFIASLLSFKYGLARSDGGHIQIGSSTMLAILSSLVLYYIFELINFFNLKQVTVIIKKYSIILILSILFLNFKIYNIYLIPYSFADIKYLLNAENKTFMFDETQDYNELIKYYKKISTSDECVQILTDEIAIPYLLNKPTCTRFNVMEVVHPKKMQIIFIEELKVKKPKVILYKSDKFSFKNGESLSLVNTYINKNYNFHSKFKNWTFVKINK